MTTATATSTVQAVTILTAQGKSIPQIAALLGVSQSTVSRTRRAHAANAPGLPTTWQDQATCRGEDPRLFIPADNGRTSYSRGRAVCMRCPVRDACLTDAMTREGNAKAEDRAGLWGGLSPEQRANLARVRQPQKATT
jgi:WhiB family redox-sensing transcriptional regulator